MTGDLNKQDHQAKRLRKRMEKNHLSKEAVQSLPPRSEVHKEKTTKMKWRLKYPVVRLLVVVFLILVLVIPGINLWQQRDDELELSVSNNSKNQSFESITRVNEDELQLEEENDFVLESSKSTVAVSDDDKSEEEQETKVNKENEQLSQNHENEVIEKNVEAESVESKEQQYIIHTVKGDENLFRISLKYYNSRRGEAIIKELNGLDEDGTVYEGQKLKIPVNRY